MTWKTPQKNAQEITVPVFKKKGDCERKLATTSGTPASGDMRQTCGEDNIATPDAKGERACKYT